MANPTIAVGDHAHQLLNDAYYSFLQQENKSLKHPNSTSFQKMYRQLSRLLVTQTTFAIALQLPQGIQSTPLEKLQRRLAKYTKLERQITLLQKGGLSAQHPFLQKLLKKQQSLRSKITQELKQAPYHRCKRAYQDWLNSPQYTAQSQLPMQTLLPELVYQHLIPLFTHPSWGMDWDTFLTQPKAIAQLQHQIEQTCKQAHLLTEDYVEGIQSWLQQLLNLQTQLQELHITVSLQQKLALYVANLPPQLRDYCQTVQQQTYSVWESVRTACLDPDFRQNIYHKSLNPQPQTPPQPLNPSHPTVESAKRNFLANINHELRTPLNGILGYVQTLQRSPDLKPHQDTLDNLQNCSQQLLQLIETLLTVAKQEQEGVTLNPQETYLPTLLQDIITTAKTPIEYKGLTFNIETPDSLPLHVQVDSQNLRQVVLNLLDNARKFTPQGTVTLSINPLTPINPHSPPDTLTLEFQVQDTGTGIHPEDRDTIFLPFEQLHSFSHKPQGLGLGLTQVRHILEAMGTSLNITSQPQQGSCFAFTLTLPITKMTAQPACASSFTPSSSSPNWVVPSPQFLTPLYQAARIGDIEKIEAEAKLLKQQDQDYSSFAEEIIRLASEFEEAKILQLVQPALAR
ncbi:HAMP domain-containing sensor histidine kinase [Spirulina sp. CS-785/01]|uniref:sensor histidine kinase n=1 Tax=Spirulina sp. CS-785/01 TaxID=3021716 RepID=UPI00232CF4E7|nr:HAMP domain-containing sensor histidine kinase [Spirulina sp. CS-785/01]MDB9314470.1 HAMP domain-containing sensor histidine kinase [Spirulina sp. CS-785/01]